MKKYKNKEIWDLYSLKYIFYMVGLVMTILAVLVFVYGLLATQRLMREQSNYEEVLGKEGNLAGHGAPFIIIFLGGSI